VFFNGFGKSLFGYFTLGKLEMEIPHLLNPKIADLKLFERDLK